MPWMAFCAQKSRGRRGHKNASDIGQFVGVLFDHQIETATCSGHLPDGLGFIQSIWATPQLAFQEDGILGPVAAPHFGQIDQHDIALLG